MRFTKALTFSYDDGVTQDKKLIEIFNKYGLKATFNLNSQLLGKKGELIRDDVLINHTKINKEDVSRVYEGHEVAAHTLEHPFLPHCDKQEIIRQVEEDRIALSQMVGYEVVGMAYPGGGVNYNDDVAKIIQENTGIRYARTTVSTHNFDVQDNLYQFHPSVYHVREMDKLFELGEQFIKMNPDKPQIFYIWGHSYEFDIDDSWSEFERFCKMMACREDIFYGTNREILLG